MDDLISRKAALEELGECPENWNDSPEEIEAVNSWCFAADVINSAPSVPAVPLDKLAEWIVCNLDPRIDCKSCVENPENFECECRSCPSMSEKQVREALEKWMEEQDAGN